MLRTWTRKHTTAPTANAPPIGTMPVAMMASVARRITTFLAIAVPLDHVWIKKLDHLDANPTTVHSLKQDIGRIGPYDSQRPRHHFSGGDKELVKHAGSI